MAGTFCTVSEFLDWEPSFLTEANPEGLSSQELHRKLKLGRVGKGRAEYWLRRGWSAEEAERRSAEYRRAAMPGRDSFVEYLTHNSAADLEPSVFARLLDSVLVTENMERGLRHVDLLARRQLRLPACGRFTVKYWTSRGWDEESARVMRDGHRLTGGRSPMTRGFWEALGLSAAEVTAKLDSMRPTQLGFWLERGHDLLSAELRVSEHQSNAARSRHGSL